ncbi:MAG: 5'/3'-nucleotidase SurE [Candidatus Hatepunaea meridiana]|nr:5'/3'-nucleotidase SurE [Candidatus Hatepunaea meridiana]
MRILLTNDDGIHSPGLKALKDTLSDLGELWIVAPVVEQSGVSHAFSLFSPLRVKKIILDGCNHCYAVHGTPVDSVKLALQEILPDLPDLVVSGINGGENTGVNIIYSGTVAAAMEGAMLGIPSIAVSLASYHSTDYGVAADFTKRFASQILSNKLPNGTMININVPALKPEQIKGVKVTFQAESHYEEEIEKRVDPRARDYYWIVGRNVLSKDGIGSDMEAVKNGYIAVTPIRVTQTDSEYIKVLDEFLVA